MDFIHPINARQTRRSKKRILRNILITLGIILLFAITTICLVPTLLSTSFARTQILSAVNAAIAPATVTIEDWSLSWFQAQSIRGMTYTDNVKDLKASVPNVTLNSLWKLLPLGKITADVQIEAPEILLPTFARQPLPPTPPLPPSELGEPETPRPADERAFVLPAWDIALNVTITEARIISPQCPQPLLQKGALTLSMPAVDEPISVTLNALLLDAQLDTEVTLASVNELLTAPPSINVLRAADLSLEAIWIRLAATAATQPGATFPKGNVSLSLNVGHLFSLVRPLAILPAELSSISGQLAIAAQLHPTANGLLQTACTVTGRDLACAYNGKTLTCTPAISANLSLNPTHLMASVLHELKAELPGIRIEGRGSLTDGNLTASVETAPLWETFAPFLGDYPLQKPVTLNLTAAANQHLLTIETTASGEQRTFGKLLFEADTLDPLARTFKALKLTSQWSIAETLAVLHPLPKTMTVEGDLHFNVAATGAIDALKANTAFALHSVRLRTTAWNVNEPKLLDGKATLELNGDQLSLTALKITSPLAELSGNATMTLMPDIPINGTLSGKLTPAVALNTWRVQQKPEEALKMAGEIFCLLTLQRQATTTLVADVSSETLALTPPQNETIPLPFAFKAALEHTGSAAILQQCDVTADGLKLVATGDFDIGTGQLALKGQLTPDFGQLFTTLPPLAKHRETFSISGQHTRDFTFEAPLLQGLPGILNYGKGNAEIAFDTVTVPGLEIPEGKVFLTLQEGVAAVEGIVAVNDGTVNLQPRVNLSNETFVLSWEPNGKILNNVRLTPKLFDTALGAINPLLTGSASPNGRISLLCESLHLPLDDQPLAGLNTRLMIQTNDCSLSPNGTIKQVLSIIADGAKTLKLEDKTFAVTVTDGLVTTDPIDVRVKDLKMSCRGSTHLVTHAIDYTVTLPLDEQLLGRSLAKSVQPGETLTLPITGTLEKPTIDTEPLLKAFSDTAVKKAKDKLSQKLEKALNKRKAKRQQQKDSDQSSREDALEDALRSLFGN